MHVHSCPNLNPSTLKELFDGGRQLVLSKEIAATMDDPMTHIVHPNMFPTCCITLINQGKP